MNRLKKIRIIGMAHFIMGLLLTGINQTVLAEQAPAHMMKMISGKVINTMNASNYTYAEVDTGKKKVWAAGPVTNLEVGETITFSAKMPMENFHSKAMERDFSVVYFVGRFYKKGEKPSQKITLKAAPHSKIKENKSGKVVKGISKAEGGKTIAEIYADKNSLKGKTIKVRGKVTSFMADVMGKNWLHIRDSSTLKDLTVTTKGKVAVDDVIILEGKLGLDKNYSYGYIYPVILEDARIEHQ